MAVKEYCFVLICLFVLNSAMNKYEGYPKNGERDPLWPIISHKQNNVQPPHEGIQWLLSVRKPDFGWQDKTHRAVIALAVNRWPVPKYQHRRQMELKLDLEITKALLRNTTSPIHPNDLAMYIHSLIATGRNPHNFNGIDLVTSLKHQVDGTNGKVHPFLLLALCNANALTANRMGLIKESVKRYLNQPQRKEYLALSLKAYECARSLKFEVNEELIQDAQDKLLSYQEENGSFGSVPATSLIIQALAPSERKLQWNKDGAMKYLERESTNQANIISTYYIQLGLKSDEIHFLKDMFPDVKQGALKKDKGSFFIQYTVRYGKHVDVYFTITIKVRSNSTFFDVMKNSQEKDSNFNFSYYNGTDGLPYVYAISGIPNNVEENLFWHLCLQNNVDHIVHKSNMNTITSSPALFLPKKGDHIIYSYMEPDCEEAFGGKNSK